jgi:hypothetical protein
MREMELVCWGMGGWSFLAKSGGRGFEVVDVVDGMRREVGWGE